MNSINSNLTLATALLILGMLFILITYWIIRKGTFRNVGEEVYSQDAYGWHFAFSFIIAALLLSNLPELLDASFYTLQNDTKKVVFIEALRVGAIFLGLSLISFFIVYYLAHFLITRIYPKTSLKREVAANNIGYVLQHAAILLILGLLIQYHFVFVCKYFMPISNLPDYR